MIRRDEAENLKAVNEKQATDIVETRAAMLSYKNMTQVFADQAKNIKLMLYFHLYLKPKLAEKPP